MRVVNAPPLNNNNSLTSKTLEVNKTTEMAEDISKDQANLVTARMMLQLGRNQRRIRRRGGGDLDAIALPIAQALIPLNTNTHSQKEMKEMIRLSVKKREKSENIEKNIPPDFPGTLVWDLLEYNYIELEKINAGVVPNSSEQVHKATDKEAAGKIKPRPFTESGEWRNTLSILQKALSAAFPSAAPSFKKYTRHVKSLEIIFTRRGNWKDIIPYDAEMRKAFAARRHLSFADFNSSKLKHIKAMAWPTLESRQYISREPYFSQQSAASSSKAMVCNALNSTRLTRPIPDGPKLKITKHLPKNQQICGGWNLDKCADQAKCGRIHGVCEVVGCNDNHKRITHPR
ncbi:uncharacterized protein MELLADRAFT_60668 [Melampsora larici-populina 98AG31]|uniref:C3H1-type domain-containing protein n=1 Tax=Melampsora larici-populina (strain 98AG31 / pathotype 3-4-7) TaxID=747676 RepID=F4RBW8_MELLP|nr:uncharacterized protein MELLADRAFT_60668 [Melampsora larici-populina 98AG31]EGG10177.1 hypothetical protein MELLADRAFT_60668 [Melampsora larici-populina 98AG31]